MSRPNTGSSYRRPGRGGKCPLQGGSCVSSGVVGGATFAPRRGSAAVVLFTVNTGLKCVLVVSGYFWKCLTNHLGTPHPLWFSRLQAAVVVAEVNLVDATGRVSSAIQTL